MEWYYAKEIWQITNGKGIRGFKKVNIKKHISEKRIQNILSMLKATKPKTIFKTKKDSNDKRKNLYNQEFLNYILRTTDNRDYHQKQKAIHAINENILTPGEMKETAKTYLSQTLFKDNEQQLEAFSEQLYKKELKLKHTIQSAIKEYERTFKSQEKNIDDLANKEKMIHKITNNTKYSDTFKIQLINFILQPGIPIEVSSKLLQYPELTPTLLKQIITDLKKELS